MKAFEYKTLKCLGGGLMILSINNWHTIAFPTFLNIDLPLCLLVYKNFWLASRGIQRHFTSSNMYSLS